VSRTLVNPVVDAVTRLFEVSVELLGTASMEGYFTRLNPAWQRTLGWTNDELMADPYVSFVHPDDVRATAASAATLALPGNPSVVGFENRYRAVDGGYRWLHWSAVPDQGVLYFVATDVTERKIAEMAFAEEARIMQAIIKSVADGLYVADASGELTFINPTAVELLGYDTDAELLGRRPHATFHHSHADGSPYPREDCPLTNVRISGEPAYSDDDTFWRKDGSALAVAFSSAPVDLAEGRGTAVAFRDITERKGREARQQREIEDALWLGRVRDALDQDRLMLYSQPIFDLSTGEQVRQELLVRMRAKDGSVVAPGMFLPAAERYGLIPEIDRWVTRQAVAVAATGVAVQFNISGASIGAPDVLTGIESEIQRTGVDPALLTIEVTETAIMKNLEIGRTFAERVTALGCSIALDDFGTGWAGLSYLKHLPVQQLKIDMEFVREVINNEADERLVRGIVGLAREFGLSTTGEGIEDEETLVKLRELGVGYGQGYLFGRPQPLVDHDTSIAAASHIEPANPDRADGTDVVRAIFAAMVDRDDDSALTFFDPDAVVRVFATSKLAGRREPYRGHEGLRTYMEDVSRVWETLEFNPTAFHQTGGSVIVFGHVISATGDGTEVTDVLWIWRLHDGLVASVEVFNSPRTD
jgi:PAS domain S-box-containing protein